MITRRIGPPAPQQQHKGYVAINMRCFDADLLRRIVAAETKRTGYRIRMVDVLGAAIQGMAQAYKVSK